MIRYENSLRLMPNVIALADEALIYDNSGEKPIVIHARYKDSSSYTINPFQSYNKEVAHFLKQDNVS